MRRNKRELTHPWNASDLKEYFDPMPRTHRDMCSRKKKSTIRYAIRIGRIEIATISHVRVLCLC